MNVICPICNSNQNISWDTDCDFEDAEIDTPGTIHFCHCKKCGTSIELFVPENALSEVEQ